MNHPDTDLAAGHAQIYRDVVRYAEMGDHRTASDVDLNTASWIRDQLIAAGVDAEYDTWQLRQFQFDKCWVEVFGKRLAAVPLWHPLSAGPEPLIGQVVADTEGTDISGKIVLTQFGTTMVTPKSEHAGIISGLAKRGARAIIGCIPHPSGEIFAPNAIPPYNQNPWPIPVALIAPSHWHILQSAADTGDRIAFMLSGQDQTDAVAHNVIGRLRNGPRWIIVSTPQTGWFRCAGERGAGVALLLDLARWAAETQRDHSFLFLSSAGHEIGHMGIHNILSQDIAPPPAQTECWLHLGASIATRAYSEHEGILVPAGPEPESWLFCSASLKARLDQAFQSQDYLTPEIYNRKHGEIRWILEQGYDAFALMGPQKFFHLPSDGPEAVDPRLLGETATTLKNTLAGLSSAAVSAA